MSFAQKVTQHMEHLPQSLQAEVLDFVEHLETKKVAKDTVAWSHLSVSQAMRGMESEKSPYSENDLKEHF